MERQGDAAVRTLHSLSTLSTQDGGCVAASIEQNQRLLLSFESHGQGVAQRGTQDDVRTFGGQLGPHVDDVYRGERPLEHALTERE